MNPGTQPKSNPLVRQITVTKAGQQVPLYILTDPWGSPTDTAWAVSRPSPPSPPAPKT
ncbi:MAG: hypothetical protein ACLSCR_02300 [Akkermansia sp.]